MPHDMGQLFWIIIVVTAIVLIYRKSIKANSPQTATKGDDYTPQTQNEEPEKLRTDGELLDCLRQMTPTDFEHFIADLFSRFGYNTQTIGGIHDEGIDVIARKDDITNYIQCKKYITRKVSLRNIRDFYGAIIDFIGNGTGYLITTNVFTNEAERFANGRRIVLIDKFNLIEYVHNAKIEDQIPESEHPAGQNQELCPRCENPLVEKYGKHGPFIGCSTWPKCWYRKKK